jgi:hypothetical protein
MFYITKHQQMYGWMGFDHPFYIIINLAVGVFVGAPNSETVFLKPCWLIMLGYIK